MKRYDDVNIIKAYACLAVFGSHWFGTFGSWGSNKVNTLMEIGPLPLFRYGTFGVSLFLIISGMLIADKVYSGRFTSWSSEILRRYLKLTCPLTVTFLLAYLFYRGGLFYTVRVAPRLENEWLSNFYSYLPGGLKAIRYAWFDTIFKADSTYYGPSWMLTYTFFRPPGSRNPPENPDSGRCRGSADRNEQLLYLPASGKWDLSADAGS